MNLMSFWKFLTDHAVRRPQTSEPNPIPGRRRMNSAFEWALAILLAATVSPIQGATTESAAPENNWPQWRGPLLTGLAPRGNPPIQWSETKNVQWKVKIPGYGTSTPIIWQDQVFILTAVKVTAASPANSNAASAAAAAAAAGVELPDQANRPSGGDPFGVETPRDKYQFTVLCLDRDSGRIRWQKVAREEVPHEGHHRDHGFASASPVTDGTNLFAYFGSRGLYNYTLNGDRTWFKDFGNMQTRNSFGEGSSPALHGDTLVINWDHEGEDFIVALDKNTGAEKWRKDRDEPTSWSTPLIVEHEGKAQVVVNATGAVRSYDLERGDLVWECSGQTANAIPTPVSGHGLLYAMSGFRGSTLQAIRLGRQGQLTDTEAIAWKHNRGTPYVPSPLLYGELLYFIKGNNAVLSCFNAKSGRPYFSEERLPGLTGIYASPVGAAGRIYVTGRDGTTLVLRNSGRLEMLATNKLDDPIDASPAVAGHQLFLRGHQFLYCLSNR